MLFAAHSFLGPGLMNEKRKRQVDAPILNPALKSLASLKFFLGKREEHNFSHHETALRSFLGQVVVL